MSTMRFSLISFFLLCGALAGCEAPGVGDPCIPEAIPPGPGFDQSEVYLETSSVQCRTRVCMVYNFAGNPSQSQEECFADPTGPDCSNRQPEAEIDDRVFCTCRCGTTTQGASTCECPSGFSCEPILDEEAGPGIAGSYCVRTATLD